MPFLNRVLRPIEPDKALLNASPYLLLGGWLLCMMLVVGVPLNGESTSWQIARWGLRLVTLALFLYAWFATSEDDVRPDWVLSWLGFALYEVTGIGLLGIATLVSSGWPNGGVGVLILPLALCAFIPWIIVCTWVASRDQQAARLIVFPHAALTAPLFLAAVELWPPVSEMALYWAVLATILVAGGFTALYETIPPQRRAVWLYVGVVLCQSIQTLLGLYAEIGGLVVIAAVLMSMLGIVILSTPFALSGIWSKISKLLTNRAIISPEWTNVHRLGSDTLSLKLSTIHSQLFAKGATSMSETLDILPDSPKESSPAKPQRPSSPGFDRLFRFSVIVLALFAIGTLVTMVGRSAIYKIHEYERGLHLRGGRFLAVQQPGWHLQIPLVDTVIIVKTNERLGYVERIPAMTSDNVTMIVSLQYTYKVTDPQQFALQVDDPERIVFEFVQGKLRDVVNSKAMNDVMNNRVIMNDQVMSALKEKEAQYGVQFVTVQLQSASPPDEVLTAIKDRMVAVQRQEQAQAEAAQKKTQADAELYTSQKQAEAEAYQITKTAEAQAESVRLMTEAQQLSIRSIISELDGKGALGEKYIDYLIAQQIKDNSKWVINGQSAPILNLGGSTANNAGGE